ncbi:hypothetical protein [Glutamicibacter ardleyensis]|uniref:hypothetical protein n=1 Tax=Glutamicibacter ardleyensis TaxID=225894 RepID=UPI003FD67C47
MAIPPTSPVSRKSKCSIGFWFAMSVYVVSAIWLAKQSEEEGGQSAQPAIADKKPRKITFILWVPLLSLAFACLFCWISNKFNRDFLDNYSSNFSAVTMLGAGFVLVAGLIGTYRSLGEPKKHKLILENEYAYLTLGGACLFVPEVIAFYESTIEPVRQAVSVLS